MLSREFQCCESWYPNLPRMPLNRVPVLLGTFVSSLINLSKVRCINNDRGAHSSDSSELPPVTLLRRNGVLVLFSQSIDRSVPA